MRSVLSCTLALILLVCALPPLTISAVDTLTEDGFYYRILPEGTAVITSYVGSAKELILPDSLGGVPVTAIAPMTFRNDVNMRTLYVPKSITYLGDAAFYDCLSLREVTIEGAVDTLSFALFRGCTALQTISLPATVRTVEQSAFADCNALETVYYQGKDHTAITFEHNNGAPQGAVWFDDAVRRVNGPWVYAAHSNGTATVAKYTAFHTDLTIPSTIDGYTVTAIGARALSKNRALVTLTVPDSVTSIGQAAFAACPSLTAVSLHDGIKAIDADAFSNCSALTSFTVPAGITHLADGLLANASSLTEIHVPDTVRSMGNDVFFGCENLRTVRLSDNLTSIGDSVFEGCTSLQDITLPSRLDEIGKAAFYGCSSLKALTLPAPLTVIKERAFKGCSALQSIRFNEDLLLIETEAFMQCTSLRHLELPCWLYILGDGAFRQCSSLESVVLPRHLDVLRINTFADCTALRRLTLPTELRTVERFAFSNCTSLLDVAVPSTVTFIERYAFGMCTALKTVYYEGDAAAWARITLDAHTFPDTAQVVFNAAYHAFPDVSDDVWYAAAAETASIRGWIHGFADGTFGGHKPCQRQDFLVMLAQLQDTPLTAYEGETGGLSDVIPDSYYAPAVAWGVEQGFVAGYENGAFGVGDPLTREQLCTILYRVADCPPVGDIDALLDKFPDSTSVSPFARNGVAWAVKQGLVCGMADGRLSPTSSASRAHVATILMRGF